MFRTCSTVPFFLAEIGPSRGRGANFAASTSKSALNMQRGAFFSRKLLSRGKFCRHLGQPILCNSRFSDLLLRALEAPKLWKNTAFRAIPAKIYPVSHLCGKTSLLSNIDAARPSGNFQYSRKLELLNFLCLYIDCDIIHYLPTNIQESSICMADRVTPSISSASAETCQRW